MRGGSAASIYTASRHSDHLRVSPTFWHPNHPHAAQPETSQVARPRPEDGFWSHPKGLSVRGTLRRLSPIWTTTAPLERCPQAGYQAGRHQPQHLGKMVANHGGPKQRLPFRRLRPPGMTSSLTREPRGRLDERLPGHRLPSSAASEQETQPFLSWASTATPGSVLAIELNFPVPCHHLPR